MFYKKNSIKGILSEFYESFVRIDWTVRVFSALYDVISALAKEFSPDRDSDSLTWFCNEKEINLDPGGGSPCNPLSSVLKVSWPDGQIGGPFCLWFSVGVLVCESGVCSARPYIQSAVQGRIVCCFQCALIPFQYPTGTMTISQGISAVWCYARACLLFLISIFSALWLLCLIY